MATLRGRDEIHRRRSRLTSVLGQIDRSTLSPELLSHYARYVAVLVSGYAEQSVKELVRQYSRKHADPRVQRYIGQQVDRVRNVDAEKLRQLVESLDPSWWAGLERDHPDELEAFKSIATVRNSVSHGGDSGITIGTAKEYLGRIDTVINKLADLLDPAD